VKPKTIEYDIGKDAYGRNVTLKYERDYVQREIYSIHISAANQLDDEQTISGLTADNLRKLADVAGMTVYRNGGKKAGQDAAAGGLMSAT